MEILLFTQTIGRISFLQDTKEIFLLLRNKEELSSIKNKILKGKH